MASTSGVTDSRGTASAALAIIMDDQMTTVRRTSEFEGWIGELLNHRRSGDTFIAETPDTGDESRLFGGLIAAKALVAANATVPDDKIPHSLHAYFLRGGEYGVDIEIEVERIRDGGSFATRRATVTQSGAAIFEMTASFHRPESSADQHPPMNPFPALDACVAAAPGLTISRLFDIRALPEHASPWAVPPIWIRTREPVPDDPILGAAILTFLSDIGPVPVSRPHRSQGGFSASLDHAIWFHRPFDPHAWHRYDVAAVNHNSARGLVRGALYDHRGVLVASTAQEALTRL